MARPSRFEHFHTHRRSRRLQGHDYGAPGWTFVTICTHARLPSLGEVRGGIVGLSEAGCIAQACWADIPDHQPGVVLDAFVVMPNHVHGLIGISSSPRDRAAPLCTTALPEGESQGNVLAPSMSGLSPSSGTVSVIVRSYKGAVTRAARRAGLAFGWQPRFHDHVVRNAPSLKRIRAYVEANPARWSEDRLHPDRS